MHVSSLPELALPRCLGSFIISSKERFSNDGCPTPEPVATLTVELTADLGSTFGWPKKNSCNGLENQMELVCMRKESNAQIIAAQTPRLRFSWAFTGTESVMTANVFAVVEFI